MAVGDELAGGGSADETGCSGDKDAHEDLQMGLMSVTVITVPRYVSPCHQLR